MTTKQTRLKTYIEWCEWEERIKTALKDGHTLLDLHPELNSVRKKRCQSAAMSQPSTALQPSLGVQPSSSGEIVVGEPVVLNFDGGGSDVAS